MINMSIPIYYLDQADSLDQQGRYKEADILTEWIKISNTTKSNQRFASQGIDKKVLKSNKHEHFTHNKEIWSADWTGGPAIEIDACYSAKDGSYIGDLKTAQRLCDKMGIIPEKSKPDHTVSSIGFQPSENKYCGWSHRAIKCFGINDKGEEWFHNKTAEGKIAKTLEEAKEMAIKFADSVS